MDIVNILVVEDERIVALDIKNSLHNLGHPSVSMAATSEEALSIMASSPVDLVLMDILLRGARDGIDTALFIHENYDVPVIYITALADERTLERAKSTQPYGYIIKPFKERDLHTTIEMALSKHETEKQLRENEERYRRFFEEDLTGDFISDNNGTIVACNPAFNRIFGFTGGDHGNIKLPELFPDAADWERFSIELTTKRKLVYHQVELRRVNGTPLYVVGNFIGSFEDDDRLKGIQGYIFDDTERKNLEQQFLQAQKMEAVGRLAGGIAHDFNNLLTVINGYSEYLLAASVEDPSLVEALREIKQAGERASMLTRQLLVFSRNQVLQPQVVDLNQVVRNIQNLLRRLIGENIEFETALAEGLETVEVDPGQMEQVIMNLAVNARDAMPGGGKLIISTSEQVVPEGGDPSATEIKPGRYAVLAVSDTGTGIDAEVLGHIFDPFFTTKAKGEGTGLGLSTVYGIVAQSNGHIRVESEPCSGTTFRVLIPGAAGNGTGVVREERKKKTSRGSETILVVEDDNAVRNFIIRILTMNGYRVLHAGNGKEAMAAAEKHRGPLHMVVTDIVMPGINGPDLAKKLKKQHPETRVLFISGYTDQRVRDLVESEDASFMQKPFTPDELAQRIRTLLDA